MPYRLKSLELNGYKTFANRVVFEFAEAITAIVGPNGSGKSNIADALRWVLGEQSYSLLRGRKTEDMIFSGSDSRPQAGMASATVIFDNTDGWLPIDFSEVSVTRRAYRDGQNEYLINNQKVRLRDVNELLSQSGLAERTYTVIGQGLVDAALSLNASERRRLFEEAAGIGLYRTRKEQSLRRLEKTRRNLDRVEDILAELKPRLRSLDRQSRRAQEYVQVRDDLKEVLREWYGFHWHRAQRELTDAREMSQVQELNLDKSRDNQELYSGQLEDIRANIHELRGRVAGWHQNLAGFHSQKETINRELAVGEERQRSMSEKDSSISHQQNILEADINLYQNRVTESSAEIEKLSALLSEAEDQAKSADQSLEERLAARSEIELKLQGLRDSLTHESASQLDLEARRLSLEARIQAYSVGQDAFQVDLAKSLDLVSSAESELSKIEPLKKNLDQKVQKLDDELADQNSKLEEMQDQRTQYQQQQTEQEAAVARLQAQIEVIDQAERNLTGYAEGVQMLLAAAKDKKLSTQRGTLSNHLEIPSELEVAIAVAIGEYADAMLLDDKSDSDKALDLLQNEAGRAALLPLKSLNPVKPLRSPNHKDCLGVASELVKAPAQLQTVVDLLLGQVLVVRNRKAARAVLADQQPHVRAVTLTGELFHSTGAIFVDTKGGSGILSRPRKRRELDKKLKDQTTKLDEHIQILNTLNQQLSTAQNQQTSLVDALESARKEAVDARNTYRERISKVEQARSQQEWQKTQQANREAQNEDTRTELLSLSADRKGIEAESIQLEAAIKVENLALSDLPVEERQEQLVHWNTQIAVARRALEEAHLRHQERVKLHDTIVEQRDGLQASQGELENQSAELVDSISLSRGLEDGLAKEISSLQALIQPAEEQFHLLEIDQESLLTQEKKARDELNVAERHNAQAQIAFGRHQESLDTLRGRIEDDFGLVQFEYDDSVSGPTPLPLGDLVERLPLVTILSPDIDEALKRQRAQLRRMGSINPEAQVEYEQVQERSDYLTFQLDDLAVAEKDLREVISELDALMDREFRKTFDLVASEFRVIFSRLFGGGSAKLILTDAEDFSDTGVDIETRLPGKRSQRLALLSGGERSLTAAALVFALLKASPTPFCVMDEVDAMLDEANIARFRDVLKEFSQQTQFVLITHNRNTVQVADVIYGITMGRDTSSQIISLKLDEVDERYAVEAPETVT